MTSVTRTTIIVILAVALVGIGIWLAASQEPAPVTDEAPLATVPSAPRTDLEKLREEAGPADSGTPKEAQEADSEVNQPVEDRETEPDASEQTDVEGPATSPESAAETGESAAIDDDAFVDLSVDIIITAMGMENSGADSRELQDYVMQRLDEAGYSADAFESATERIVADSEHSREISKQILEQVKRRTGVQMEMRVLPMLDPDWEYVEPSSDSGD